MSKSKHPKNAVESGAACPAPPALSSVHEIRAPDPMRRTPQQLRSRRMVNAIVEAATVILQREGRAGLSTTSLELVSGVSKASIYQYFPNLDAVVAEVFHDVIRHRMSEGETHQPPSSMTVTSVVTMVVDSALQVHRELLQLDREFYCSFSGHYDLWQAFDESRRQQNAPIDFLKQCLEQCRDLPTGVDLRMTCFALGRSIELTVYAMLRDDPDFLTKPEFRNTMIRMGRAIVAGDSPAGGGPGNAVEI